jgi:GGDEF domain-containing protein
LRETVSKVFGLQKEIKDLRTKVEELSRDEPFGMWTRGAFLQFCRVMPRGIKMIVFIDLDDIHSLNERYGYSEVDRRVRSTFSIPFRCSDLVARWFSGDEIVILLDCEREGAEFKIAQLRESAQRHGLSFTHEIGEWDVGRQSILMVIEKLSTKNCRKKNSSRSRQLH